MTLRRGCAALLIVSATLAGAPSAVAAPPARHTTSVSTSTTLTADQTVMPLGVSTGGKSWLCRKLGLFC